VTVIGYSNINSNGNGDGDSDSDGDGDGNCNGNAHGNSKNDKGWVASSCAAMCSIVVGATPCLHPHGHKRKCIHQRCTLGMALLKSVCSLSRGRAPGFLTAHHGFFCLFFASTVKFTEQPSVCPPHYSGTQEPCQSIDAQPPPLLQEPHWPIDNLPRVFIALFVKVSPGRACNDYKLTFCVDVK
jgi:hypothetical protein